MALMSLKPLSGASVPIVAHGGERCGVLVACALHRSSDSATFESLERLARIIAERYEALGPARVVIPEFRQEPYWERLRDRPFGIDVYRSTDCRIPWHYRPVTETSRLLTFGVKVSEKLAPWLAGRRGPELSDAVHELVTARSNAPSFAAAIDLSSESMTYAACGFTPPISFVARGPMGSFRTTADDVTMGTATLRSPGEAAIFDSQLWRWVSARNDAAQIRTLLEKETPSGLASLVTLGL
jgi:hypothetical protein